MKIKAFTILEMIINLALMSIIVSMVYVVYGYFSKNMTEYSLMTTENFEMASFNTRLKEDFYKADKIISTNGGKFTVIFYDETSVVYRQGEQYLYRENSITRDSIRSKGVTFTFLYSDLPKNSENLIKNVLVNAELYGNDVSLFAYKKYFSNYLNLKNEY
ncbi:hypothetical protein [Aequorivita antarctica]|uniref:Prepilin-type N-terminal cleavage/methylation domain-containing protein n=1 Tax=Aequorivita antarctica TaxID=153266 RepID=A0A5C6YYU3_9FLAO|nr:hypothetical protein [Aequorivita antarctica]TXD72806.1 hypothetical protein ESU54_11355 [Aequorivita antarctica]SRX75260.1 hypothetical protein AEQU3_02254 [Aequorivita antarctica]